MISGLTPSSRLPREIYALFAIRLVVSAGSFVGPFLAMMLTGKLGYGKAEAGAFMSAVSLVGAAGLFIGGKLGDSFDRPKVLACLQALTALAYVACGIVGFKPITPFIIAFAMGTLNGTWPILNALVADSAPEDRRKEAFSLIYWGNNIGFSAGPIVAGLLFVSAPRALFFGNALAILVAAGIATAFVKVGRPEERKRADAEEPQVSTLAALAANPILILYAAGAVLGSFVYGQQSFALPLYLKDIMGDVAGPKAFGAVMTTNGLTVVAMTALVVLLSKRLRSLTAVALSFAFYAVGFGAYGLGSGLPWMLASTFVWTLGEILGATNGNAFIAERAPATHRSRINSAISLAHVSGSALAPLVAGPLAAAKGSAAVWPVVAACAAVGAAYQFGIDYLDARRGRRGSASA